MRVLLVEDNGAVARAIELMLRAESFNVYHTESGEEAVDLAKLYEHDIVLLDLSLPDISGFEVLRSLRTSSVRCPVLIVSGHTGVDDKIKALRSGADDYITKPFHRDELVARVYALVRRSKGHADPVIQIDDLVINLQTKTVAVNGTNVYLTAKEYKVLEVLSLRAGKPVSKDMFLNHIYGGLQEPSAKIMDVYICKLRRKLEHASQGKNYIGTHWGRGYVLRDPSALTEPVFA